MSEGMRTAPDQLTVKARNAARTRSSILTAAQRAFATKGYAQVSIREIANAAGVDPALIRRYFGSKLDLFALALSDALDVKDLLATSHSDFGRHVAAYLISGQTDHPNPLPMMMMAMADPLVRPVALNMLQQRVLEPLAAWIGGPEAIERAARVSMICAGFLTYLRLLPLQIFQEGVDSKTLVWLEMELQQIVQN